MAVRIDRIRVRPLHAMILVGVLSILPGCADATQRDTSHPAVAPTAEPATGDSSPSAEPDVADGRETPVTDGVEPAGTVRLQQEILADGVVTEREMFLAMQATVECIQRQGFKASTAEHPSGGWSLTVSYRPGEAAQVDKVTALCEQEYSTRAQLRYAMGRPSPETDIDVLWNCLLERGVLDGSVTDPTIAFQIAEATNPDVTWECFELGENS